MTDDQAPASASSLLPLIGRWWWLLMLGFLVGAALGVAAASVLPKRYESKVDVLVGPVNTDVALEASGSLAATYQNLVTSRPVLASALKAVGSDLPLRDLEEDVTATSNTVTRIVTINVDSEDAQEASRLANAIALRLADLANQPLGRAVAQFEALNEQPEVARLGDATRRGVTQAVKRVFGASKAGQVTVVNPAVPADGASSPKTSLLAALGAIAGTLAATLLALALDSRSRMRGVPVARA